MPALAALLVMLGAKELAPEIEQLDNGLHVVVVADATVALLSVQLWFDVGSLDDPPEDPGRSDRWRAELAENDSSAQRLRVAGVRFGSRTLPDASYFISDAPASAEFLEYVLAIEAERLRAAAAEHGRATLLVIGDVQPPTAMDAIRRHFDPIPPGGTGRLRRSPGRIPAVMPALTGPWLVVETPGAAAADNVAIPVLMHALCNPIDGPLHRAVRDRGDMRPAWRHETWRDAGVLRIGLVGQACASSRAPLATELRVELERIVREPPGEVRHNRARSLAVRDLLACRADFDSWAWQLGWSEVVGGDLLLSDWVLERTRRLPVGEVQRAAALLLESLASADIPQSGRSNVSSPSDASTRSDAPAPSFRPRSPERPTEEARRPGAARDPHPAVVAPPLARRPAIARHTVREGVELVAAQIPDCEPVFVATVVEGAGAWVHRLPHLGTADHTAAEWADYLGYHALTLATASDGIDGALLSTGPADQVPQMLEIQAHHFTRPRGMELDAAETTWRAELADVLATHDAPAVADWLAAHAFVLAPWPACDGTGNWSIVRDVLNVPPPASGRVGAAPRLPWAAPTATDRHLSGAGEAGWKRLSHETGWNAHPSERTPAPQVDLVVVSGLPPADVLAAARDAWAAAARTDRTGSQPVTQTGGTGIHPVSQPGSTDSHGTMQPVVYWIPGDPEIIELRAIARLRGGSSPDSGSDAAALRDFAGQDLAAARVAPPAALAGPGDVWRSTLGPLQRVTFAARVAPADLAAALRALQDPARDADNSSRDREGADWAHTARLAAAARLLALDGAAGLGRVLMRTATPYAIDAALPPAGISAAALGERCSIQVLIVVGGDQRVREALSEFGAVTELR